MVKLRSVLTGFLSSVHFDEKINSTINTEHSSIIHMLVIAKITRFRSKVMYILALLRRLLMSSIEMKFQNVHYVYITNTMTLELIVCKIR
jgi:hypothetical protein